MSSIDRSSSAASAPPATNPGGTSASKKSTFSKEDLDRLQQATHDRQNFDDLASLLQAFHAPESLNASGSAVALAQQALAKLQNQPSSEDLRADLAKNLSELETQCLLGTSKGSSENDLLTLQAHLKLLRGDVNAGNSDSFKSEQETLGSEILSSFMSSATPLSTTSQAAGVAPASRDELSSMLSQMVDRLLVGDSRFQAKGEVQMKLSDSVLPQTELKLWRGEGGQLHVEFITQSAEARELLMAKLPMLSARLNEQFATQPHAMPVQVNLSGGDDMPQDGRSRQRYEPPTDEEALT